MDIIIAVKNKTACSSSVPEILPVNIQHSYVREHSYGQIVFCNFFTGFVKFIIVLEAHGN